MAKSPRRRSRLSHPEKKFDSTLGPVRFWAKTPGGWAPVTPTNFSPTMKRSLPSNQLRMIRAAFRDGQHFSRNAIYALLRRGFIDSNRYHLVREFIRAFIFTPREENGETIFRAPTVAEVSKVFPDVGRAIAQRESAVEVARRARTRKKKSKPVQ